jgi:hypothetical protein
MIKSISKYLLISLLILSCNVTGNRTFSATPEPKTLLSPTTEKTIQPLPELTSTPNRLLLPSVTLSPLETENAIIELLRTNGNCVGKCLGGIYPDKMTLQEAVDVMSQWGMINLSKNSQGRAIINLNPNELFGQFNVYLSVGTWTKELETIDRVSIRIDSATSADTHYIKEDVWLAYQDMFRGFQMDSVLKSYGIPSYVGYDFSSILSPSLLPRIGERFSYGTILHFEEINLQILIGAMALFDGQSVFLCPSKEPHYLYLEINPERPLKESQNAFPVTWQALTDTDLNVYYQIFTVENAFDVCVTTNIKEILKLQP